MDARMIADADLISMAWERDGRDVSLRLSPSDSTGTVKRLLLTYADELSIQLRYGKNRGGFALTWGVTSSAMADGRTLVRVAGQRGPTSS